MTASIESMRDEFEVATVALHEITVEERQRKDYGDIDELAKNIKETCGLIQPLAVQRLPKGYRLLAGGRRFMACMTAGLKAVPVRIYPQSLDAHQMALIENIENVYRKDFTVEESLRAAEAVHNAQVATHGEKIAPNGPGWSQNMTAELLNMDSSAVSNMLSLAKAAKQHPEIAKAKNIAEAKRVHKSIKASEKRATRAAEMEQKAATEDVDKEKKILCACYQVMDCLDGMKKISSETFDIAEVDPPYAINYAQARLKDGSATTLNYNEIDEDKYLDFMDSVLFECARLLKADSWLILWHANDWESRMLELLHKHGFSCRLLPAVWWKKDGMGITAQPKRYLGHNYEQFFYACKGKAEIWKQGRSDVFPFPGVHAAHRSHPTERPIELIKEILDTFAAPGSTLLVPFAGSGNTLLAASNSHITAVGFDLTQQYKDTFTIKVHEGTLHQFSSYKEKKK